MKLTETVLRQITSDLIAWIRNMMTATGGSKAVIGISGGKDSSVVAALCTEAIGPENVYGILMPNGLQTDISYSHEIVEHLGIHSVLAPITPMVEQFHLTLANINDTLLPQTSIQTTLNLPPRVRMTLLYAISQSIDSSRVINTSNLSEDWVGYATIYGDTAGAFAPIGALTTDEVVQIGRHLDLPEKFIIKTPEDGLTGKTDEDFLGFSYNSLNRYIREGQIDDPATKRRIDTMHRKSRFKFVPIPVFEVGLPVKAEAM